MANYSVRQYGWAASTIVSALALAVHLDNYIPGHLIWGGSVCETSRGIYSCAGYPPTGLILLFLTSGAAMMFVSSLFLDNPPEMSA